jgi:hypothetical protein
MDELKIGAKMKKEKVKKKLSINKRTIQNLEDLKKATVCEKGEQSEHKVVKAGGNPILVDVGASRHPKYC